MDGDTKQDTPVKQRDIQPEAGRETGARDNMSEPGTSVTRKRTRVM